MTETSEAAALGALEREGEHLASQTWQLWERAPLGFAATIVNGLITIGILRSVVDADVRWAWFAALALVTAVRYVQRRVFLDTARSAEFDPARWKTVFDWGIGIGGVVWGSSAIVLYAESVAHQTFLAFVLGGMVAGATATFSTSMTSFLAFTVPALSPLILRFFSEGDELHVAMGGMILLFGVLLTGTAHRISTLTAGSFGSDEKSLSRTPSDRSPTRDIEERYRARYRLALHEQKHESMATFVRGIVERLSGPVHVISENTALPARYPVLMARAPMSSDLLFRLGAANEELLATVEELSEIAADPGASFRRTDVSTFVESTIHDWSEEHGYRETIDCELSQVPEIRIDRRQCRLALEQLLMNAREASASAGGAAIRVEAVGVDSHEIEPHRAYVHGIVSSSRLVSISVSDGGVGIPPENLERIFDPFYSTKDAKRGLGLTIVAAVVRCHGGEITVESRPERGTTVTIYLPVESG